MKRPAWKYLAILAVILIVIVSVLVFRRIGNAIAAANRSLKGDLPSTYVMTAEDSSLIAPNYIDHVRVQQIARTKIRNPVSQYYVDSSYLLIIHRLDLASDAPLPALISSSNDYVAESVGSVYRPFKEGLFEFAFLMTRPDPIEKIFLSFHGDSVSRLLANDSVLYDHLNAQVLSLKYGPDKPHDIAVESRSGVLGRLTPFPMEVMFQKRNRKLYLILLTPLRRKDSIPCGLLKKIII